MRKLLSTAAAIAALLAGASMPAQAYIVVELKDATSNISKTCNTSLAFGVGNCNAADGWLTAANATGFQFIGSVGSFTVGNLSTFQSLNAGGNVPGTLFEAKIDQTMNQLVNTTGASRDFFVSVSAIGYTMPTSPFKTLFGSASVSTAANAGTATSNFFADGANLGGLLNGISCGVVIGTNASCAASPLNWLSGPQFSLTQTQLFSLSANQDVNATNNLSTRNTVPEPLSTSLVGAALLALALTTKRRGSKKA